MGKYEYDLMDLEEKILNGIILDRKLGVRKINERGYDVISNDFFVNELVKFSNDTEKEVTHYYEKFSDYYKYLNGDIYENSYYYQLDQDKYDIDKGKIDLYSKNAIIDYTIDDCFDELMLKRENVKEESKKRNEIKKWIDKFNACISYDEFEKSEKAYYRSKVYEKYNINISFFVYNYIYFDLENEKRMETIIKYISSNYISRFHELSLFHIYNPDKVVNLLKYDRDVSDSTKKAHERDYKKHYEEVKAGKWEKTSSECGYSKKTCFFYEISYYLGVYTIRYFETFYEFIKYRNYDITNTDLSKISYIDFDFNKCKKNDKTKLPINNYDDLEKRVNKYYKNNSFYVDLLVYENDENIILSKEYRFKYFFDFVYFLKGDLSGADLLLCDGMLNLLNIDGLNLNKAKLSSKICDKYNIKYEKKKLSYEKAQIFDEVIKNEKETKKYIDVIREGYDLEGYFCKVYYIFDIHLIHKFGECKPECIFDYYIIIKKIINNIIGETDRSSIVLIGGDISSDIVPFKTFVEFLSEEKGDRKIIFILGNHELWNFDNKVLDEIIEEYKEIIEKNGMYFMQNNILFYDKEIHSIESDELYSCSEEEIKEKVRSAKLIFFGGIGFAGCNNHFNANLGIYRNSISRKIEIMESEKFSKLYDKIVNILCDRKVIIFTHMPMIDWYGKEQYNSNFIYVSGHTHKNYFYDDGEIRVYSDNQIGYYNNNPHMKYFDVDVRYDYFASYENGIFEISTDEYIEFYRGHNIMMTFNRKNGQLYMIKKNDYYCFFFLSRNGTLSLLNGGALSSCYGNNLNYFFDNMDKMIAIIRKPYDKYSALQKKVSDEIKKIGGSGKIHGCIVDIGFFEHLYINPIDKKITAYTATDIINKKVYNSVAGLLKKERPMLYENFRKIRSESNDNNSLIIAEKNKMLDSDLDFTEYLSTDIYKVSRDIKKMQKLDSNILSYWNYDEIEKLNMIKKLNE